MFHVRDNGDYAEVLSGVNPWGEAPRGAANGIYEMEAFPLGENGKLIDITNSMLDTSKVRIVSPAFRVDTAFQARQARRERDALLIACDCVVLEDYPIDDKTAWKAYRQALRDVPGQASFPGNINWPVAPT